MAVPNTKVELLAAIDKTYAALTKDLAAVPPPSAREQSLAGHAQGTFMSPADLVAYLIGWNQQILTWHERRDLGLPDEFPAPGFKWNELGALAQHYYEQFQDRSWEDLLAELDRAKAQVVMLVESKSDDQLYGQPWYGKWTMGRMISFNTSSPYANARGRIRKWLREQAG